MKHILVSTFVFLLFGCTQTPVSEEINTQQEPGVSKDVIITDNSEIIQEKNEEEPVEKEEKIIYDELSLQTLMQEEIIGSDLVLEQVLSQTTNYTRYRISYKNGDISLSGIMNIPNGTGPYPLLVLNHGYIDTRYYTNGRGLKREQDYFANNGFAVIHPDYRNHAYSDKISEEPYDFRLGYTRDVIASILAVQKSELEALQVIDSSNVGMLGHSMGGGISQNIAVVEPNLIKALVLYGTVNNNEYKNFEQFQLTKASRSSRVQQVFADHKTPEENPLFWEGVSSATFIENIQVPVMLFSGTADQDTPTQWAESITQDLKDAGKEVELIIYPGEGHEFGPKWSDFMLQSKEFFKKHLQ